MDGVKGSGGQTNGRAAARDRARQRPPPRRTIDHQYRPMSSNDLSRLLLPPRIVPRSPNLHLSRATSARLRKSRLPPSLRPPLSPLPPLDQHQQTSQLSATTRYSGLDLDRSHLRILPPTTRTPSRRPPRVGLSSSSRRTRAPTACPRITSITHRPARSKTETERSRLLAESSTSRRPRMARGWQGL